MSFIGKPMRNKPRDSKPSEKAKAGPFEVDVQGDAVLLYRWLNDGERVLAGYVRYVPEEQRVEIKLGVSSVRLDIVDALAFFRACRDLVEEVWRSAAKPRVAWLS